MICPFCNAEPVVFGQIRPDGVATHACSKPDQDLREMMLRDMRDAVLRITGIKERPYGWVPLLIAPEE